MIGAAQYGQDISTSTSNTGGVGWRAPPYAPVPSAAPAVLALAVVVGACAAAPPMTPTPAAPPWPEARADADLQAAVEALAQGFDGVVGVYARHLPTGRTAALRADDTFPTASLVKVPILATLFEQIEAGAFAYDQELALADAPPYPHADVGLVGKLRPDATVAVHTLAEEMVAASDNTASFWLQHAVGGGAAVNDWLGRRGYETTRVNSRTPGREDAYAAFGWGQTTPREIAGLLRQIVEGGAVSPAADLEMHRLLTRTHWDDEAVSAVPPGVQVASKQGSVMESRSEVAYVHAPSGPYVFAVVTRDQGDTRYAPDNAGYELIRAVSRLLWDTFEPGRSWTAPPGSERYRF